MNDPVPVLNMAMTTSKHHLTIMDLKGRQSVRATFRLPDETIDLLRTAARELSVKQKSLLDQLIEDRDGLRSAADTVSSVSTKSGRRRPKTFVLSRKALSILDETAANSGIARDSLVELVIGRLAPLVLMEQQKQLSRTKLLAEAKQFRDAGRLLLQEAETLLEEDDRFRIKLALLISKIEKSMAEMEYMARFKKK